MGSQGRNESVFQVCVGEGSNVCSIQLEAAGGKKGAPLSGLLGVWLGTGKGHCKGLVFSVGYRYDISQKWATVTY